MEKAAQGADTEGAAFPFGARYGDVACRNHPLGGLPLA
jgi:hypothetical protein